MDPILQLKLRRLAMRRHKLRLWSSLATVWAVAGFACLALIALKRSTGWSLNAAAPVLLVLAVSGSVFALRRLRFAAPLKDLALEIERSHPELDGRLLTSVRERSGASASDSYFEQRLLREVLQHEQVIDWAAAVPQARVRIAWAAHWAALLLFAATLWVLRPVARPVAIQSEYPLWGVNVSPGDTNIERGSSLVVLARFGGQAPDTVSLVLSNGIDPETRIPLVKSLADPLFGITVPEVGSNLVYRVEYAGKTTRGFAVQVFEYPKLERSDVELVFPEYTRLSPKRVEDTRRVSGVEGTRVELTLGLNKPVKAATLKPRDKSAEPIPLTVEAGVARAVLKDHILWNSGAYDLVLVDDEGRSNKVQSQFNFNALTNRAPEMRLASPRGDLRPSPLEEIAFEGTVWDDFGVHSYGLGYSVVGGETKLIELGSNVPASDKKTFHHVLSLEDLGVEPDQLVSWFVWAEDAGIDGDARSTVGDLFFGEIRPFEEIFREGQGMEGQQGQQSQGGQQQQQGSPSSKLAELQKQIISATWKLQRDARLKPIKPRKAVDAPGTSYFPATRRQIGGSSVPWPAVSGLVFGAPAEQPVTRPRGGRSSAGSRTSTNSVIQSDPEVVRDSQAEVLKQAKAVLERQEDPKAAALWRASIQDMEKALESLKSASDPASYERAIASEQAAYQALLKLREHEYNVTRGSRQSGSQGGQQGGMQQQLQQMELTQSENRYETRSQAQRPANAERGEDLQILNRLQELARRQQDINERLKELQSSLQEAQTEEEREELRRQLKRLQDQERQMLADVDELRQRMDRPENQSRMNEQREQLDQTRENIQRAADAAAQGSASQALASGTRAQNQLQDMRDDLRRQNSNQFSEDLRQMRNQARELAQRQQELLDKMASNQQEERKTLSDARGENEMFEDLAKQNQGISNLVTQATEISREAEATEPLLSRQLEESVRKFSQSTGSDAKQLQEQLLNRGMMTRNLMDQMRNPATSDATKLVEAASEMLRMDFRTQAKDATQRLGNSLNNMREGVERAAESVLGDDTEALRLAQQRLDELAQQLGREIAEGEGESRESTNTLARAGAGQGQNQRDRNTGAQGQRGSEANERGEQQLASNQPGAQGGRGQQSNQNDQNEGQGQREEGQGQEGQQGQGAGQGNSQQANNQQGNRQEGQGAGGDRSQQAQNQSRDGQGQRGGGRQDSGSREGQVASSDPQRGPGNAGPRQLGGRRGTNRGGAANAGGAEGGDLSGSLGRALDMLIDRTPDLQAGPITGEGFVPWSDRLRDVEEMIDETDLRDEVARVRDRARQLRQDFKRDLKKPDWAVVRLQVMKPLVEVRDRIADELSRRESREALVPIDRDPVPTRYSELVRKYYEELGK